MYQRKSPGGLGFDTWFHLGFLVIKNLDLLNWNVISARSYSLAKNNLKKKDSGSIFVIYSNTTV